MGFTTALEQGIGSWHRDAFERTCISLELDFLGNRKLGDRLHCSALESQGENVGENSVPTMAARHSIDDKVFRKFAQLALAIL